MLFSFEKKEKRIEYPRLFEYNNRTRKKVYEMKSIIRITNLDFSYEKEKVFSSFSMEIKEGSFTTIIGPNQSGKTTLIKLMAGLLPNQESVILEHQYIESDKMENAAQELGVVLSDIENKFLFNEVYQELCYPLENLNYSKEEIEKRIQEISALLELEPLLDKRIERLTSTEKKKVFFALALLHHPKLLLLDNPFAGLTEKEREKMRKLLKKLNQKEAMTIVLATNNLTDTLESDYVYVLNKGKIGMEGAPLSVLQEEKILNQIGLELPFMVDLSLKLKFYEVYDRIETDMDRMVNDLWK